MGSSAFPAPPPDASSTKRGLVNLVAQSFAGAKTWLALAIFSLGARFDALVSSTVASGSDAFKLTNGARLNLSDTDVSAYFLRSAANVISTPGSLAAYSIDLAYVVGITLSTTGRIVWGGGNYLSNNGATGSVTCTAGFEANHATDGFEAKVAGAGVVLASPNGTRYRLTVSNAGALVITAA